jgi:hypothetical protein
MLHKMSIQNIRSAPTPALPLPFLHILPVPICCFGNQETGTNALNQKRDHTNSTPFPLKWGLIADYGVDYEIRWVQFKDRIAFVYWRKRWCLSCFFFENIKSPNLSLQSLNFLLQGSRNCLCNLHAAGRGGSQNKTTDRKKPVFPFCTECTLYSPGWPDFSVCGFMQ